MVRVHQTEREIINENESHLISNRIEWEKKTLQPLLFHYSIERKCYKLGCMHFIDRILYYFELDRLQITFPLHIRNHIIAK